MGIPVENVKTLLEAIDQFHKLLKEVWSKIEKLGDTLAEAYKVLKVLGPLRRDIIELGNGYSFGPRGFYYMPERGRSMHGADQVITIMNFLEEHSKDELLQHVFKKKRELYGKLLDLIMELKKLPKVLTRHKVRGEKYFLQGLYYVPVKVVEITWESTGVLTLYLEDGTQVEIMYPGWISERFLRCLNVLDELIETLREAGEKIDEMIRHNKEVVRKMKELVAPQLVLEELAS